MSSEVNKGPKEVDGDPDDVVPVSAVVFGEPSLEIALRRVALFASGLPEWRLDGLTACQAEDDKGHDMWLVTLYVLEDDST